MLIFNSITPLYKKAVSTKNRVKWEKGPDLPREFIMGGSLYDKEKGEWILVGGTDIHGMKQYSDIIRYNKDTNKFEFLPAKLKVGRYGFGALLAQVSDKCWMEKLQNEKIIFVKN